MTEAEFIAKWHQEQPVYGAWGCFVKETIERKLKEAQPELDLDQFLKIAKLPRLKEDDSLLEKAFHRGKPYTDPYTEITDKVGLRFVVLLTAEIAPLQRVIEDCKLWKSSLDKDYELDREARPLEFAYQSKHFVVTSNTDVEHQGTHIPPGIPCEIQLRTLLQHAHSELTHDNIYKVQEGTTVTSQVRRTVAKSMALIEAVEDFFSTAIVQLNDATAVEREAFATLAHLYHDYIGAPPGNGKTNQIVLHAFRDRLGPELGQQVSAFLDRYSFVVDDVRRRATSDQAFRQPWVLLTYFMVHNVPNWVRERWPLTPAEVQPIYTVLGK